MEDNGYLITERFAVAIDQVRGVVKCEDQYSKQSEYMLEIYLFDGDHLRIHYEENKEARDRDFNAVLENLK